MKRPFGLISSVFQYIDAVGAPLGPVPMFLYDWFMTTLVSLTLGSSRLPHISRYYSVEYARLHISSLVRHL